MNQRGSGKDVLGLEQASHACLVSRTHAEVAREITALFTRVASI